MIENYSVYKGRWPEQEEIIFTIRKKVFVIEQGVDPDIEWDGQDNLCKHVIAFSNDHQAIGTGRLLPNGHIGRIAVMKDCRGQGVGSAILEQLIELASNGNTKTAYLNSQSQAIAFYHRFGFVPEGKVFMEAGIQHQRMTLILKKEPDIS